MADMTVRAQRGQLRAGDTLVWTGSERVAVDRVKVVDRRKVDDSGWWMTDGSGLADYVWERDDAWTTLDALLAERDALAEQVAKHRGELDRVTFLRAGGIVKQCDALRDAVDAVRSLCDRYEHDETVRDRPLTGQQVAAKIANALDGGAS